ncbi:hypothetical protein Tco_0997006 [Tanacetum coccineum]
MAIPYHRVVCFSLDLGDQSGYEITINDLSYVNLCPWEETIGYELLNGIYLLSGEIFPAEDLNNKSKQNPPSHKKGSFQDRLDNQSIERDRLIGIGFVLNFVKFISFTFGDKEMISMIEAVSR